MKPLRLILSVLIATLLFAQKPAAPTGYVTPSAAVAHDSNGLWQYLTITDGKLNVGSGGGGGGGGSGTVTSVATGAGLTGGPITTSGTIAVAPASVCAPTFTTLTDSTTTVTWAVGNKQCADATLALSATPTTNYRTLNMTGMVAGGQYKLYAQQTQGPPEQLTLGSGCNWYTPSPVGSGLGGGEGTIVLVANINAFDPLAFTYDGTNCYVDSAPQQAPGVGRLQAANSNLSTQPTLTHVSGESGYCSASADTCSIAVSAVNGDVALANCVAYSVGATATPVLSDTNGNDGWNGGDTNSDGATFSGQFFVGGINVTESTNFICTATGATKVQMFVDSFNSSTGSSGGLDANHTSDYDAPGPSAPTITAGSQASEQLGIVYGSATVLTGDNTTASGFTILQHGSGEGITGWYYMKSPITPSFVANDATSTTWQGYVVILLPN